MASLLGIEAKDFRWLLGDIGLFRYTKLRIYSQKLRTFVWTKPFGIIKRT